MRAQAVNITGAASGQVPRPRPRRNRKLKTAKGCTVAILVLAGYLVFFSARVCFWVGQVNGDLGHYRQQKEALLAQRQMLEEEVCLLNTKEYIERLAREQLGLIKPGETLVVQATPGDPKPLKPVNPSELGD
jgi:cell division protein FtsB